MAWISPQPQSTGTKHVPSTAAAYEISDEEQEDLNRRLLFHAMNGDLEDTALTLAEGADVDSINGHGWSCLHLAIANSHEEIARLLIDNGANVEVLDNAGMSPLFLSAMLGKLDILQPLLEAGAKPNTTLDPNHDLQGQIVPEAIAVIKAWQDIRDLDAAEASSHALMNVFNRLSKKEQDALDVGDIVSRAHSRMLKSVKRRRVLSP